MVRVLTFPKYGTPEQIRAFRTFSRMIAHVEMCDDDGCIYCKKRIGLGAQK